MTLFNNLYKIDEVEQTAYTIALNPDSTIFKAHFPGQPVMPGVCTVQIAVELAEQLTGKAVTITDIKNAKFIRPILPSEEQTVVYDFIKAEEVDDTLALQVIVKSTSNDIFAKLSLRCRIL